MSLNFNNLYQNIDKQKIPPVFKFKNILIICLTLLGLNLLGYFLLKLGIINEIFFENLLLLEYTGFAFPIIHHIQKYKWTHRIISALIIILISILFYYFLPGDIFIITAIFSLFILYFLLIPEDQWNN